MDSNTLKFGQLASLTAFTGQQQATEALATAAINNEMQVASLNNLSLGVEASYKPHKLGQGTPNGPNNLGGVRETYRAHQQAKWIEDNIGVENIDKQHLLDYKRKVDAYVEMKYLPESAKAPKHKGPERRPYKYSQQEKDAATGFAGL